MIQFNSFLFRQELLKSYYQASQSVSNQNYQIITTLNNNHYIIIIKSHTYTYILIIMNSSTTPSQQTSRTLQKLDDKKIQSLKRKYNLFKQSFTEEQAKFTVSDQSDYYIISTEYLKQWTQYAGSNQNQRYVPIMMNQDLMDAGGQLKKGLIQGKDFQIVNEKIYNIVKAESGFHLQRSAVYIGTEKRVPIYLDLIKYVKIRYNELYQIQHAKIKSTDIKIKLCEISMQSTIQKLIQKIKRNDNIGHRYKVRLWKNNINQLSTQDLYKYIREKTMKLTSYRFDGLGKLIDDQKSTLEQLNLGQQSYFIVEVSDEYSTYFFKSADEQKCQNCYKYKKLPFVCGCKTVAYCSQECEQRDRRFHIRNCKFAEEQQINEEVEMNIGPNSALGKVGLSNLGNTCFMNSCLQCLSNTSLLTDYFIKKYFDKEINKDNPLGSKGKLVKNYAKFIKNMWCESQSTFSPHNLKAAVAKLNPIFAGYAQHDSQQFFSFIADGLHEDLNRVIKKPYVQSVQSKNRPDQIVALQSWTAYTARNQSIIVDLLTGQYKSKVICPICSLQSITFDPFTTVSLPIPQQPTVQTMKFYVIYNNYQRQAQQMSFQYLQSNQTSVKQWTQTATKMVKKNQGDFVFYVLSVYENVYGFQYTARSQIVNKVQNQKKSVFFIQLSEDQKKLKDKVQLVTRFCKKIPYQKQFDNLWFKRPFFFEKQTTTGLTIYVRILKNLYNIYVNKKSTKQQDYVKKMVSQQPFVIVFKYKKSMQRFFSNRVQTKFQKQIQISNLSTKLTELLQQTTQGDYELDARFTSDGAKLFQFAKLKKYQDADQWTMKKQSTKAKSSVSIYDCFKVFEQKQQLEQGNQWYCPQCKQHRLATKQMTIYKAPQILILHLKRFKNKGTWRKQKNQTTIQFPMQLNMKDYIIDPKPMSSYIPELINQNKYIAPHYKIQHNNNNNSQPLYQLYAISNHYGGLGGGHYTAYAKNKQKWYQFNDSSVHAVSQDGIKGSGAYMLFYRRVKSMEIM